MTGLRCSQAAVMMSRAISTARRSSAASVGRAARDAIRGKVTGASPERPKTRIVPTPRTAGLNVPCWQRSCHRRSSAAWLADRRVETIRSSSVVCWLKLRTFTISLFFARPRYPEMSCPTGLSSFSEAHLTRIIVLPAPGEQLPDPPAWRRYGHRCVASPYEQRPGAA